MNIPQCGPEKRSILWLAYYLWNQSLTCFLFHQNLYMYRLLSLLLVLGTSSLFAQATDQEQKALELKSAGAVWRVNQPSYRSLELPNAVRYPGLSAKDAAAEFLHSYAPAFGGEASADFRFVVTGTGLNGNEFLRFQQQRAGVRVLGAEATVEVAPGGNIVGYTGTLLPLTSFAPAAAPNYSTNYTTKATAALQDKYAFAHQWTVTEGSPTWTSSDPWDATASVFLTRVFDVVEPAGLRSERVYLDAQTGKLVFRHQLHCTINREQFHVNANLSNRVWSEGDVFPGSLDAEDQEMLTSTAETYNLYNRTFGRDGYDGADGLMRGITQRTVECPNASASGNFIWHCPGLVTDDVVGHEWTHNYIGRMSGLIYAFESGAINEGFADIFGEAIDLINSRGGDTQDNVTRTACNNTSVRWKLGEDASGGAIRDMWNPECRNDPSSRSSARYECNDGSFDSGGVHINSGLVNRTFSILVDGGTLNGTTVTGIGLTKALHIFYHTQSSYMTPVTNFFAMGDMLQAAANDLLGINLPALTLVDLPAAASGEIISAADLTQVANAVAATQLMGNGPCVIVPTLAQSPPEACADVNNRDYVSLLSQDWEAGFAGWTVVEEAENNATWDAKPWVLEPNLADGRAGQGVFAPNPRIGDCVADLDNGLVHLTSPQVSLPPVEQAFRLTFNHYYSIEDDYDGGVLYMQRNGGSFQYVPEAAFVYNGYDDELEAANVNDNPLAGLRAFNGSDFTSTAGTWGQTVVDLTAAGALPSDNIRLRWTIGHDGCNGWLGWYLDEVEIGYCGEIELPVEYLTLSATAEKSHVRISWSTENEEENFGFHLERRAETEAEFQELGFVPASGTTTGEYTFDDQRVLPGTDYTYRLQQTDFDGASNYSPLVSARTQDAKTGLTAWPNPVRNILYLRTGVDNGTAVLYDVKGRLVREVSLDGGFAEIDLVGLKEGIYFLRAGDLVKRIVR
jgi:Zn-dependent metalloprotease